MSLSFNNILQSVPCIVQKPYKRCYCFIYSSYLSESIHVLEDIIIYRIVRYLVQVIGTIEKISMKY